MTGDNVIVINADKVVFTGKVFRQGLLLAHCRFRRRHQERTARQIMKAASRAFLKRQSSAWFRVARSVVAR